MLFRKDENRKISKITWAWTTLDNGQASIVLNDFSGYEIIAVQTVPGTDGDLVTNLPNDNYNVILLDAFNIDWFFAEGHDRKKVLSEVFFITNRVPFPDSAKLTINNAGSANQGLVNIWIA